MKCILLSSGGLDSLLVERILNEQNIETKIAEFKTPFFGFKNKNGADISGGFFNILKNPEFGYGKNLNPCIDCKILMLKAAKEIMDPPAGGEKIDFIATGEVVGQRPMSQNKETLLKIEKEAGLEGLVLRPLSARILPETIPEKQGWVNREKLYNISGRSRSAQMELAKKFNIKEYPTPSGGCLLTDAGFSMRMIQLMQKIPDFTSDDVELIKNGRFFTVGKGILAIGRNKEENDILMSLELQGDIAFDFTLEPGPFALLRYDDSFTARLEAEKMARKYI